MCRDYQQIAYSTRFFLLYFSNSIDVKQQLFTYDLHDRKHKFVQSVILVELSLRLTLLFTTAFGSRTITILLFHLETYMIDFRDGVSLVSNISLNDLHRYLSFYRCKILSRFVYFFVCSTLSTIFSTTKKELLRIFPFVGFGVKLQQKLFRVIKSKVVFHIEILSCLYFSR